ncbi:hypothetical protein V6N13_114335 [Hibiscus sabdariffa]
MPKVVGIEISSVLPVNIYEIISLIYVFLLNRELVVGKLTRLLHRLASQTPSELKLEFVHCRISDGLASFLTTFVYASPYSSHCNDLWFHLRSLALSTVKPWALIGDFNATFLVKIVKVVPLLLLTLHSKIWFLTAGSMIWTMMDLNLHGIKVIVMFDLTVALETLCGLKHFRLLSYITSSE